jgi:pyridoxine 5-phosphate synthase
MTATRLALEQPHVAMNLGQGPMAPPIRLGINIDHVATLRNARGGHHPDPLRAAQIAVEAGADNITAHLREDRRHITDDDIARLMRELRCPLNLEMAATPEMLGIALKTKPHAACLVPEKRSERTTEGGLDVLGQHNLLVPVVSELADAGIRVSLFIAPEPRQIEAAARLRAPAIEIHVGVWCDALDQGRTDDAEAEWRRIRDGAKAAHDLGLEVHAGHGLNYATAATIAAIPEIVELNIGHFLIGEALFVGLGESVRRMRAVMDEARAALRQSDTEASVSGGAR